MPTRERSPSRQSTGSSDRFGFAWARYADLLPAHETQFARWTAPLGVRDWRGISFLDVGCGMGRNSYWPLKYGAARGMAIDADERCVAAARAALSQFPNADIQHLSVYDLSFEDAFDICFSIGVIHHLEDPARAVAAMVRAAKPGGRVLIWVYGYENNAWIVKFVDPIRKRVLSKLPVGLLHHLSLYPTLFLWGLVRCFRGHTPYWSFLRTLGFSHLRSIVFDQLLPRVAHYWRRNEVQTLMTMAGLHDVQLQWTNRMSWTAIGTKAGSQHPSRHRSVGDPEGWGE